MNPPVTLGKYGAAGENRTPDPVITNEGNRSKTRTNPTLSLPENTRFDIKVRKSAQGNMRNLRYGVG